LEVIID